MPKLIIDTDIMASYLKSGGFTEEGKGIYLLSYLRKAHVGGDLPDWLEEMKTKEKKGASIGGYSPAFLKFWEAYPPRNGTRTGKAPAMKAWKKVKGISEQDLLFKCLSALEWQKQDEQWVKDNGTFIPMATTYINQRRWEDEGNSADDWEEYTDMNGAKQKRRKT